VGVIHLATERNPAGNLLLQCAAVTEVKIPPDYDAIDRLIDEGDLDRCRERLAATDQSDEGYAVLRIKLSLFDGTLDPPIAMQKLINLMRRQQDFPGAKALYQIASDRAYQQRESSVSLSHIPPPVKSKP
jgi:hypothetical protein